MMLLPVALRRAHRLKLPDAIIWASADLHGMLLVSRDTRAIRLTIQASGFRINCLMADTGCVGGACRGGIVSLACRQ